jgi:hypothetical protein
LSSLLKLIILVHGYSTAISLGTHRAAWRWDFGTAKCAGEDYGGGEVEGDKAGLW